LRAYSHFSRIILDAAENLGGLIHQVERARAGDRYRGRIELKMFSFLRTADFLSRRVMKGPLLVCQLHYEQLW
jgi:hypothetical protein